MLYSRQGRPVAFLVQPYTLSTEDVSEVLGLCKSYNLEVDISMKSEWNVGQTLGVLFWRKELNPFVPPFL